MNRNTNFIPFARPSIGPEEEAAVLRVLRSGWLTTAGEANAFEAEFAETIGTRHALAVNSATAGLHLALEGLGIGPGDRVATSTYTFTASAEIARYLGADPVLVDIEDDGFNISPDRLAEVLAKNRRCRAVVPVHLGGRICRMGEIRDAASSSGAAVVEDCAHAFPSPTPLGFAGTIGNVGVFSFYATKPITTGEGGMLVTNDDSLAARASLMRLHGIDREVWQRYTAKAANWRYEVVEAGYKYNMTDLAAAMGRAQLKKAWSFLDRRRAIAEGYQHAFGSYDCFRLPPDGPGNAWHLYILRLVPDRLRIDRDEFAARLTDRGVGVSVHYIPLHLMPYYQTRYGYRPDDFPNALAAFENSLSLPIYPDLTDDDRAHIVRAVTDIADSCYTKR